MEKREMAGDYEILQAVRLGGKEVLLGYNPKDGCAPYMTSYRTVNFLGDYTYEIGMEFARRMFGERYEVVIGTHLDKAHLHNHIIINSVSFVDGQKYHSSPESYYNGVRGTSDELCRENDLSVITSQGKGKHYGEWKAEQDGKPTVRSIIREDIDRIIGEAYTYQTFLLLLQRNYNALGDESAAWRGDTPLATVELTIPADMELYTQSFWPWNQSELTDLAHSRPNSRYYVEAWDYFLNGVFQYTRYSVVSL